MSLAVPAISLDTDIHLHDPVVEVDAASGDLVAVAALRGGAKPATRYRLWLSVAEPGDPVPIWEGVPAEGSFDPERADRLLYRAPIEVPAGSYEVSLWLHQRDRHGFIHADVHRRTLDIPEPATGTARARPAAGLRATLAGLDLGGATPALLTGHVGLDNLTAEATTVTVNLGVEGGDGEARWLGSQAVDVPASGHVEVPVDPVPVVDAAGTYRLIVHTVDARGLQDRAWSTATHVVAEGSTVRHRAGRSPQGLVVHEVARFPEAGHPSRSLVVADVENLTAAPQRIRAWWIADLPGTDDHVLQGGPHELDLGPRQRTAVVLDGLDADLLTGDLDLSVAVHRHDGHGWVHGDQAWDVQILTGTAP